MQPQVKALPPIFSDIILAAMPATMPPMSNKVLIRPASAVPREPGGCDDGGGGCCGDGGKHRGNNLFENFKH